MRLQLERWKTTLVGWKKAAKNCKTVVIGDFNLDHTRWNQNEYRLKKMVQMVKDQIETEGFCQVIREVTRSWPSQPSSLVDHLWTNHPGCLMSTKNAVRASSDHNHISATIRIKDRVEQGHQSLRRDRSKLNIERYKNKIKT